MKSSMHDQESAEPLPACSCCRVCRIVGDEHTTAEVHQSHDDHGPHPADEASHGGEHADHADHTGHELVFRQKFWGSLALSVPILLWSESIQTWFGYTAPSFPGSGLIVPLFATIIFFYGGWPFLSMSRFEIRQRKPAMMTLIALAISVAYIYSMLTLVLDIGDGFFWELATLIDIMLLGHWMEMRSVRQASGALGALARLMPNEAEVVEADGEVHTVDVGVLSPGSVVLVRPGASVPADAVISDGSSSFDESLITGESRPVDKSIGDRVIAGTVNSGSGAVRATVEATGDATTLSSIMRLVAEAEASRSPTQLLADRAASLLFYAALAAAALTALVWTGIYGGWDSRTVARVVTVLVIACPHALGLAIPLVVANTTSIAARNGILIRRREAIDTAKDLSMVVFDKTGTLTKGQMGVTNVAVVDPTTVDRALAIAAAVEADSEHPMARAIRNSVAERGIDPLDAAGFSALKGRGVTATVGDVVAHVGGPRLIEYLGADLPEELAEFAENAGPKGESVVYVFTDSLPVAAISIADVVRPESFEAVKTLKAAGAGVGMITGDSNDVAEAVAGALGLDVVFSEVLPADKDAYISKLQGQGERVGMVGDGVNDAPALVRSDIGIAIGSGTDVAVQSADLVLVKSDPRDVPKILRLSRASYGKQLQNVWWGAGYNVVMIPLAAGVLVPWGFDVPPALGAALMSLSTIIVAVNAQLLRRVDLRS